LGDRVIFSDFLIVIIEVRVVTLAGSLLLRLELLGENVVVESITTLDVGVDVSLEGEG